LNNKSIFLVVAIAATMATGIGATMASTVVPAVYADKDNTKNDFGQGASQDLAKDGEMGQHASDPLPNEPGRETPRHGIGNVLNSGDPKDDPDSKHPSDLFHALCPPGSPAPECNPNP
jgi:hypothetical protein